MEKTIRFKRVISNHEYDHHRKNSGLRREDDWKSGAKRTMYIYVECKCIIIVIFQLQMVTFNGYFLPNGWNFINKTTNKTDPSVHRTNFFQPRFAKVNTTLASFVWPYLLGFYENHVVVVFNLFEVQSACFKGEKILITPLGKVQNMLVKNRLASSRFS